MIHTREKRAQRYVRKAKMAANPRLRSVDKLRRKFARARARTGHGLEALGRLLDRMEARP